MVETDESKTDESKNDNIKIKFKVYPYVDENRKGNHVGDIKLVMNTDNLPFTYFDQVDHMMHNLFGYVRDRDNPKEYFKNKTHEITYTHPPIINGGKHRKTMKKSEKTRINKKSKITKRKTYKR
jgi:hypothetical protein